MGSPVLGGGGGGVVRKLMKALATLSLTRPRPRSSGEAFCAGNAPFSSLAKALLKNQASAEMWWSLNDAKPGKSCTGDRQALILTSLK